MDNAYQIIYVENPEQSVWGIIGRGINHYNTGQAGDDKAQRICFAVQGPDEEIVPGVLAYTMQALAVHNPWTLPGFLAGLSVVFLSDFYFLGLTLMLGAFFSNRGPVICIALGVLFLQQYLVGMLPFLRYVLPWNLMIRLGQPEDAVIPCLLVGSHNYSPILIAVIALESILFIVIGLWRFGREEF